jgi:small subunit ribosomal protein S1
MLSSKFRNLIYKPKVKYLRHFYLKKYMAKKTNKYIEPQVIVENAMMQVAIAPEAKVLKVEDVIEGSVLAVEKSAVFVDVKPFGTGIIYGYEYIQAKDVIRKLNIGDTVTAKVTDLENENGYIELSLKEARQALVWADAEESIKAKKTLSLPVKEANRGGLIIEWQGILGFLPSSQLGKENYPKVEDGDKDKIAKELKKLVGKKLDLVIITANPKEGKLIFAEKSAVGSNNGSSQGGSFMGVAPKAPTQKYSTNDIVEGVVSGVVEFGIFIKLEDKVEGLVHISEISWSLIENPRTIFKIGEKIKAKVIDVKDGKISLSIKALTSNPWETAGARYKKGDKVSGVVIKFNKHGALVSVEEGVSGLLHVSEFGTEENMKKVISLGKICHCLISSFDAKDEKMILTLKDVK